jgi:response regulator of citrate/malate metabolism
MPLFEKLKENEFFEMQKESVLFGATLEILRELREKIDKLAIKIERLEKTINDKIPEKALSESTFKQEIVDSEEVVAKILAEIRKATRPIIASKQQLTFVEQRTIEKIISFLQEHGRLSSSQLAQLMQLSRTRCNEYFKLMENLGLVEGIDIGKERYYRLKN